MLCLVYQSNKDSKITWAKKGRKMNNLHNTHLMSTAMQSIANQASPIREINFIYNYLDLKAESFHHYSSLFKNQKISS